MFTITNFIIPIIYLLINNNVYLYYVHIFSILTNFLKFLNLNIYNKKNLDYTLTFR